MSNKGLNQKFKQDFFRLKNPQKYRGKTMPFYRSSYELEFMKLCDECPLILEWSSENTVIPYVDRSSADPKTGKCPIRKYFVDFWFKKKSGDKVEKFLAEIKPYIFTQPPVQGKRRKQSSLMFEQATYVKNQCKWEAQDRYAKEYGMKFIVITERELGALLQNMQRK